MLKAQLGGTSMGIRKGALSGKMILQKLFLRPKRPALCCLGSLHLLWAKRRSPSTGEAILYFRRWHRSWSADWLPGPQPLSGYLWATHNSNSGSPERWQRHAHWPRWTQEHTEHLLAWTTSARVAWKLADTPLPRSFLSSSGTISAEHCVSSHRTPGPRQPEGLFFPH